MTPSDENELWLMLNTGYDLKTPVAVRYPRGSGPGSEISHSDEKIEIGKAKVITEVESDVVLLSFGSLLSIAEEISEELNYSLIDMRFVKPIDESLLIKLAQSNKLLVTLEENVVAGGAGSAVNEVLNQNFISTNVLNIGIPDHFPKVGSPLDQKKEAGLGKENIIEQINRKLNSMK